MKTSAEKTTCQDTKRIVMVGVGGQGVLTATDILALTFVAGGYDVKKSEVHGMAQRGGSVESFVCYGQRVHSPLVVKGKADVLLALEELEALRYLPYLREGGLLVANQARIAPLSVTMGEREYPQEIESELKRRIDHSHVIPALKIAQELGNSRMANTVVLGCYAAHLDLEWKAWEEALSHTLPQKYVEPNLAALKKGYQLAQAR